MNVLDFAQQMEKEGEKYYRDLAQKTANLGLKSILNMLADDEVNHFKIIASMKEYRKPEVKSTSILSNTKNIFQEMKEQKKWDDVPNDQVALYKKAQEIEMKSFTFYMEKYKIVEESAQKKYFLLMAEEEKRHYFLLENIIQFVSRPKTWLENAEFNHLDQY